MSSPWGKVNNPTPIALSEIMSEEVAKDLQEKEYRKLRLQSTGSEEEHLTNCDSAHELVSSAQQTIAGNDKNIEGILEGCDHGATVAAQNDEDSHINSDLQIAKMLQQQYDREYDNLLTRTERKLNGTAKVGISFDNYRRAPRNDDFESDSEPEEAEDPNERRHWDRFDAVEEEYRAIPPCGYRVQEDGHVSMTKHDITMSARRNACKLMNLPPDFNSGDGAGFDLKISNKIFNSLRAHSKNEQSRRHYIRDKREDRATAEFGLDEFTRLLLYKLINSQMLKQVNGVISIGKEAVVLHADTDPDYEEGPLPQECVLKVFKTTLSEYKQRDKYIKDDYRFKDRMGKQNTRGMVQLWAEKEMHNLRRLERAHVPCPKVVALKKHVLVMSFIGRDHKPAQKLKYAHLNTADSIIAYDEVVKYMKTMYSEAKLVHADLSEYNILWYNDTCYFIDVSQAVEPTHENAFYFLKRDCNNIINFFAKKAVPNIQTADELFEDIVGCPYGDKIALAELQDTFKRKPHLVDVPGKECVDKFENAWEQSETRLQLDAKEHPSPVTHDLLVNSAAQELNIQSMPLVETPKA